MRRLLNVSCASFFDLTPKKESFYLVFEERLWVAIWMRTIRIANMTEVRVCEGPSGFDTWEITVLLVGFSLNYIILHTFVTSYLCVPDILTELHLTLSKSKYGEPLKVFILLFVTSFVFSLELCWWYFLVIRTIKCTYMSSSSLSWKI